MRKPKIIILITALYFGMVSISIAGEICPKEFVDIATTPTLSGYAPAVKAFNEMKYPTSADVIFVGDSHIGRLDLDRVKDEIGITNVLEIYGAGDGPHNTLWRLKDTRVNMRKYKPKYVVFALGTNVTRYPSCAILEGISAVLKLSRSYWPKSKFIYVSLLPRGAFFNDDEQTRQEVNRGLNVLLDSFGGKVVDIDDDEITCNQKKPTLDTGTKINAACIPVGDMSKCNYFENDHIHLTRSGYSYLLDRVLPYLK